jgi:hypothetical protein
MAELNSHREPIRFSSAFGYLASFGVVQPRRLNGGWPWEVSMASSTKLIKVGRQGILYRNSRIPASFFRHNQPGKQFVVLAGGDRQLMHVRASDLASIRRAYAEYALSRKSR